MWTHFHITTKHDEQRTSLGGIFGSYSTVQKSQQVIDQPSQCAIQLGCNNIGYSLIYNL